MSRHRFVREQIICPRCRRPFPIENDSATDPDPDDFAHDLDGDILALECPRCEFVWRPEKLLTGI